MMKKIIALIVLSILAPLFIWAQGFTISGTNLVDANGNNFIIKGINLPLSWFVTDVNNNIANIKKNTGINCARIVVNVSTPDASWQACVQNCINNNIIPMVELHDVTGNNTPSELNRMALYWASKSAYFTQPAIAKYILINIANEWSDWYMSATATGAVSRVTWRDAYITAVKTLRDAGIKTTLVCDAAGYGQDNKAQTILTYAKAVQASDPLHNCLFSIHMYCEWAKGGNSTVATDLPAVRNAGIPIIVGEFGWQENIANLCDIDEVGIINTCEANGIGWIAWSWKGNGSTEAFLDLSADWAGTSLNTWGQTVVNGANGTKTGVVASVFTTTTNPTPTVNIAAPANNSSSCYGTSIIINANPTITTGSISKVDFYDGTTLLGSDNTSPYSYTWVSPSTGAHTIGVIATSAANIASTKVTETITVNAIPAIPTVTTPINYMQNTTAVALTATGTALKWFTVATGGTVLTASPIPTTSVVGTTNYYVSQTLNTCESARSTIAVIVTAATTQKVSLKVGWNYIGCPISGSTPIAKALSSIWSNVQIVKNLDAFYSSANAPALNSLTTVEWGKGYMIKVTTACDLDWIVQ